MEPEESESQGKQISRELEESEESHHIGCRKELRQDGSQADMREAWGGKHILCSSTAPVAPYIWLTELACLASLGFK